ncbi:MAG: 6-bladed beta-propeller [Pseudomonadota bacterium]
MKRKGIQKGHRRGWLSLWGLLLFLTLPFPLFAQEEYRFERMWPTLQQPWYFQEPLGIALDGDGNFYVADTGNNRIQKFTSDGQFVAKWGTQGNEDGEFLGPSAIALDSSGYVYVVDTGNNRIQKFTTNGQFVAKWGTQGSGDGQLVEPSSFALDTSGYVYVADTGNNRIQKFTSDGQFVTKWGSSGSANSEFNHPSAITVDASGYVYVADTDNHRIQKFTANGQFVAQWGRQGEGDGEFSEPSGLAVDGTGYVYVADFSDRIQKFTSGGQFVTTWGRYGGRNSEFIYPHGLAVDSSGYVYVADTENNRIQKFTSDGQFVAKFASSGSENGEFIDPSGIAVDSNGYVYVADSWNARIQKFTSEGQFVAKWGSPGEGDGEFSNPYGLAIDSSGFIYVADFSDRIQKFTLDGLYVTKWGSYGSGDGEFTYPHGIAVDNRGYVYVADTSNHRIQKFTSNGQFVAKWGTQGSGDGNFAEPSGIAVDSSGYVYVADTFNNRIQKFTSDGQFVSKWGSRGNDPGTFFLLSSLALDSNGRVFAGEHGNNRIQVFSQGTVPTPGHTVDKAIIVAGGGPFAGNNIWDATRMCANFAYRALTYQGFTKGTIYYLTSDTNLDLDGNGLLDDVDSNATNSNFQSALTTWAQDAEDLFVYMVDHGGAGTFRMGEIELLQASDLDTWLDTAQGTIPGKVILVYDACRSGSFLPSLLPPTGKERFLVTSTSANEEAVFTSQGTISFSFLFWGRMFSGDSFYDSYVHAKSGISVTYNQNPLLDGNGNGIGNERNDQDAARTISIGNETRTGADIPVIGSVSPVQTLTGETSATIYAANVIDADGIGRVWAVITPPSYASASPDTPVTNLPILEMNSVGSNRYEGTYTAFTEPGTYNLAIYAMDTNGIISLPKQTTITQQAPLNVSGLTTDVTGPPPVNTPVKITFTAQGNAGGTLYYQYWQASGYQTSHYGNWQMLKDWSTDNTLTWTPSTNDHYVIVAYVAEGTNHSIFHQAGLSIETQRNSSNPIQITELSTTMDYPQNTGRPITLHATATGGNGSLFYKFWYYKEGTWNVIREYSTMSSWTWTPTEEGLYTVVVWVTDDTSVSQPPIAGMTCTIEQ